MDKKLKPFVWKRKELNTIGEVFSAALKVKDAIEAQKFLDTYVACGIKRDIALSNLGYFAGYYGEKERRFVDKMFGAQHPIFGNNFNPTPGEALDAGMKLAKKGKRK
jgi:hypothetical protein